MFCGCRKPILTLFLLIELALGKCRPATNQYSVLIRLASVTTPPVAGVVAPIWTLLTSASSSVTASSAQVAAESPAPRPSPAVQQLLDEANQAAAKNQLAAGLATVERGLARAREAGDR